MAGEADSQLDVRPKAGMSFYTFTLRDVLGRDMPGQMEARSEDHVRAFLSGCGYELLDAREGWYAMRFTQTPADRSAAVARSVEEMLARLFAGGDQNSGRSWRVSLSSADDEVAVSTREDGQWARLESWPPDAYPALRERLARMADIRLASYGERHEGLASIAAGDRAIEYRVVIQGNRIELG